MTWQKSYNKKLISYVQQPCDMSFLLSQLFFLMCPGINCSDHPGFMIPSQLDSPGIFPV
nr:MAG TPA: hypothetical protein [Caudoviricetes sp.]DAQ92711.1 MAG TPA: hypothetical protein [Caudoviricetes sp.]